MSNRELAAALGTSHRILDYYFHGRSGLIAAMLDRMSEQLQQQLGTAAGQPQPSLQAVVEQLSGSGAGTGTLWLEVVLRARRGEPEFVAAAERIGAAWNAWLVATFGVSADTADAIMAGVEGAGIIEVSRGSVAAQQAQRRLLRGVGMGE